MKKFKKVNIKEYYSQLSEIIRRYIELRFKFIALELTTNEILQEVKPILENKYLIILKFFYKELTWPSSLKVNLLKLKIWKV